MSLWTRNPTPCSCLSSFPLKKTLCPSSVVVSPKFFHLISQSPRMFHLYLSISCVSSWSFPAALSVLVFQVPMVMLSLPQIFADAPVAYLTPPSWCTMKGAILVDLGGDRSSMIWLFIVIAWWVIGKVHPDGAHPSPSRTRGCWVHCGTLPSIWPFSSNYEDICPVMLCWHQLFHPQLEDSWRVGESYSFPYRSKGPAHCPNNFSIDCCGHSCFCLSPPHTFWSGFFKGLLNIHCRQLWAVHNDA